MSERSLFNVASKILGLFMVFQGVSSLAWAFLASRFADQIPFDPPEAASWFYGLLYTALGLFLCGRSSSLTRLLFRLDGPLDEVPSADDDQVVQ